MTLNEIIEDLEHTVEYFKKPNNKTQVGRLFQADKTLQQLRLHVVVERYLFEGRDLTNNQPFKKVIDAENRESAIADMEVSFPHLKWVMTTKV